MLEITGQMAAGMGSTPDFYIKKNGDKCSKGREKATGEVHNICSYRKRERRKRGERGRRVELKHSRDERDTWVKVREGNRKESFPVLKQACGSLVHLMFR